MIKDYKGFINEGTAWDERFDMSFELFLNQVADANMRIFMGCPRQADLQDVTVAIRAKDRRHPAAAQGPDP